MNVANYNMEQALLNKDENKEYDGEPEDIGLVSQDVNISSDIHLDDTNDNDDNLLHDVSNIEEDEQRNRESGFVAAQTTNSFSSDQIDAKVRQRFIITKTVALGFLWICMGAFSNLTVTTLPDLRCRVNVNYEQLSRALAALSIGSIISGPLGGVVSDRWIRGRDVQAIICTLLMMITIVVRPWVRHLWLLGTLVFFEGFFGNFFSPGVNNMVDRMWGKNIGLPRHCLTVCWTLGELIAPVVCRPFFIPGENDNQSEHITNISYRQYAQPNKTANETNELNLIELTKLTTTASYVTAKYPNITLRLYNYSTMNADINGTANGTCTQQVGSPIEYPYLILCALVILPVISLAVFYYKDKTSGEKYYVPSALDSPSHSKKNYRPLTLRQIFSFKRCGQGSTSFGAIIFILIGLYYFTLCFMSTPFWQFIMAYAVDTIKFTKAEAALLMIVQRVVYIISGIIWGVLTRYVPIQVLLFVQILGELVVMIYFNVTDIYTHEQLYWFICVYGIFSVPNWATGITWGLRYIEFTSLTYTVMHTACSVATMLATWVSGYVMEYGGHEALLQLSLGGQVAFCLVVIIMQIVGSKKGEKFTNQSLQQTQMNDVTRTHLLTEDEED